VRAPEAGAVLVHELGLTRYGMALSLQRRMQRLRAEGAIRDALLITEHEPVITLGRSHPEPSLRVSEERVGDAGIAIIQVERGGDITYHGPGQLIVYGIIGLRERGLGALDYLAGLEEAVIRAAGDLGIEAGRSPAGRGVWASGGKMASVGINVRRGVTMHGIAWNVSADLGNFELINPCGMSDIRMASISGECGRAVSLAEAAGGFLRQLSAGLGWELERAALPPAMAPECEEA